MKTPTPIRHLTQDVIVERMARTRCPRCGAPPNKPCVGIQARNRGRLAAAPHVPRWYAARAALYDEGWTHAPLADEASS